MTPRDSTSYELGFGRLFALYETGMLCCHGLGAVGGSKRRWRRSLVHAGSTGPPEGRRPEGSDSLALIHHRPGRSAVRARGAEFIASVNESGSPPSCEPAVHTGESWQPRAQAPQPAIRLSARRDAVRVHRSSRRARDHTPCRPATSPKARRQVVGPTLSLRCVFHAARRSPRPCAATDRSHWVISRGAMLLEPTWRVRSYYPVC